MSLILSNLKPYFSQTVSNLFKNYFCRRLHDPLNYSIPRPKELMFGSILSDEDILERRIFAGIAVPMQLGRIKYQRSSNNPNRFGYLPEEEELRECIKEIMDAASDRTVYILNHIIPSYRSVLILDAIGLSNLQIAVLLHTTETAIKQKILKGKRNCLEIRTSLEMEVTD